MIPFQGLAFSWLPHNHQQGAIFLVSSCLFAWRYEAGLAVVTELWFSVCRLLTGRPRI